VRELATLWVVLINGALWGLLQPGIGYLCTRIPASAFDPQAWLYRERRWEKGGAIYQRLLSVKRWKAWLPSWGAALGGFSMQQVKTREASYLERWVRETCRAELTHWLAMGVSGLFFLWNRPVVAALMVVYALLANGPCIVAQRYNRPRLGRLASHVAAGTSRADRPGLRDGHGRF
jgi:glycosyl-4,4'-diaponeurosporenoate acyltransferase